MYNCYIYRAIIVQKAHKKFKNKTNITIVNVVTTNIITLRRYGIIEPSPVYMCVCGRQKWKTINNIIMRRNTVILAKRFKTKSRARVDFKYTTLSSPPPAGSFYRFCTIEYYNIYCFLLKIEFQITERLKK